MSHVQQTSTRERLLMVAGRVFAARGYEAATVREICQQAGANMAAVSYYFRGKEELYKEAIGHAAVCLAGEMPRWPPGTPAETKLRIFIHALVALGGNGEPSSWQVQLLLRRLISPPDPPSWLVRDVMRPFFELLLGILEELVPPDVATYRRHLIAFSVISQCLPFPLAREVLALCTEAREPPLDAIQVGDYVAEFTLAALGLAGPPTAARERYGERTALGSHHDGSRRCGKCSEAAAA